MKVGGYPIKRLGREGIKHAPDLCQDPLMVHGQEEVFAEPQGEGASGGPWLYP